ncbi:ATP-binding protein [Uliginosibacterium sp. H3]|uniref:histidine kinase n=1 Tax=Uliginosibacterium silvisoli TaxID=3114758 RepID=A0ABU6K0Q4_9RHOO|nr:ATP-binding protein [Uliginosibacterium sp. H3]
MTSLSPTGPEVSVDSQEVRLLRNVWRFMLFVVVPALIMRLIFLGNDIRWNWIAVPNIALVGLGVRYALRVNRVWLATQILSWGLLAMLAIQCMFATGIRSPAVMAFPVVLTVAGWLQGRRTAMAMLVVTVAWLSGLTLFGRHWEDMPMRASGTYWLTAVMVCGLACVLAMHLAESNRRKHEAERLAAVELASRLDELQKTRDKLATLFHLNPTPISVSRIDDGTYYDTNPAWARISGWSREEMVGKTSTELGIWLSPQERQDFVEALRHEGRLLNYLARFRTRSGEVRHFLMSSELVEYDGHPSIFSAFVDITERRAAEESLERLNAELEQRVAERTQSLSEALDTLRRAQDELVQSDKLASLGSLVAGVAHELNTPIGNAVLIASTLAQDVQGVSSALHDGGLRKSALESFIGDTGHAIGLLDQSLTQARDLVSSFKQVAIDQSSERRRSFALDELVRDICETVRPSMRNHHWRLETELAPDVEMDSYPGPLGQVITNLVQNAFFHGLQENMPGLVRVETRPLEDEQTEICVSDNGRGIPPENLGLIFDPFFTTRLGQGGSGLGLAIVYRLVTTLLGGRISVDSTPGEGTRFTVVLPCKAPVGA